MAKVSNNDICTSNRCETKGQASDCFFLLSFTLFFFYSFSVCCQRDRSLMWSSQARSSTAQPLCSQTEECGLKKNRTFEGKELNWCTWDEDQAEKWRQCGKYQCLMFYCKGQSNKRKLGGGALKWLVSIWHNNYICWCTSGDWCWELATQTCTAQPQPLQVSLYK